jgi:hypothetical protein
VEFKALDLGRLTQVSSTAREMPAEAFAFYMDAIDVPPGYFLVIATERARKLCVKISYPIPD